MKIFKTKRGMLQLNVFQSYELMFYKKLYFNYSNEIRTTNS